MNNSGVSESTEIASQVSNTQHTSGFATSEINYVQTVQDIENQNMQAVSVEVEQPIVIDTSFNQQQHKVQDIENPNLEGMSNSGVSESTEIAIQVSNTQHTSGVATSEINYVQTVHDIENQNMQAVAVEVKQPIVIGTSFNQQQHPVQDIENPTLEGVAGAASTVIETNWGEFDGGPPNVVQQQDTVQDNDPNQNWEGLGRLAHISLLNSIFLYWLYNKMAPVSDAAPPPEVSTDKTNIAADHEDQTPEAEGTGSPSDFGIESMHIRAALEELASSTHSPKAEGNGRPSNDDIELMYRAAFEGDWATAEELLMKDPTLAYQERYGSLPENKEESYRPLHVAVALKHDKFARKLIEKMDANKLELKDSNDITACGNAAASGSLDIAREMIKKNSELVKDPLTLVWAFFLSGKSEVISFFLKQTGVDHLDKKVRLKLLQHAINSKMNDVAIKILEKDDSLATESNKEGTALHVLARQDISAATTGKTAVIFKSIFGTTLKDSKMKMMLFVWKIYEKLNSKFNNKDVKIYDSAWQGEGELPPYSRSLAKKLLAKIQEMDEPSALRLLSDPPILHDAAKVGNMQLIHMLTRAYPDLIWQTDEKKRSLIHIAIESREANVFSFIQRFVVLGLSCFFQENEEKNNLLHLASKLGPSKNTIPALQMQSELAWFKAVESMLPPLIEKKNKDKKTPRDLFVENHEKLLEESRAWMKSTADSCMLIATIILTVVYAAAFTVPGGNNEATGLPILVKSNWLTCFFIFEALALFSSTLCIITFWSMITCSGFEEDQFLNIIPYQLRLGFSALFSSLIGAIAAFLSAYHMVLVEGKARLVKFILLCICVILFLAILGRFRELWYKTKLPKPNPPPTSENNIPGPYSMKDMTDEDKGELDPGEDNLLNVDCTL